MKITFFSTQPYDQKFFLEGNKDYNCELNFLDAQLNEQTASLVDNAKAICIFVNDRCNEKVIGALASKGVKLIALRCAGFNNVDLKAAHKNNIKVVRVPAYSPHAVAEHALAMIMSLNRKTHKAYNRIREQNFALHGLLGFDLYGKTVGVIGTGNIGNVFCHIMKGIGCKVLAFDVREDDNLVKAGVIYSTLEDVLSKADILSLHCPLNKQTQHIINADAVQRMKDNVMLINTSRGALIDSKAVIQGLKSGKIGSLGIDVYEQEEKLFFRDLSETIIEDDTITRLMSFPNVLITAHQGFFTHEALSQITHTTLENVKAFSRGQELVNEVHE